MELVALLSVYIGIAISTILTFRTSWQDHAKFIELDTNERHRRINELRGGGFAAIYSSYLSHGLNFLDSFFGEQKSPRSINICILIALLYSYFYFYLSFSIGSPGGFGGSSDWLPKYYADSSKQRITIASYFGLAPFFCFLAAFFFGRSFGIFERILKIAFRRQLRPNFGYWERHFRLGSQRKFKPVKTPLEIHYRLTIGILLAALAFVSIWIYPAALEYTQVPLFGYIVISGVVICSWIGIKANNKWMKVPSIILSAFLLSYLLDKIGIFIDSNLILLILPLAALIVGGLSLWLAASLTVFLATNVIIEAIPVSPASLAGAPAGAIMIAGLIGAAIGALGKQRAMRRISVAAAIGVVLSSVLTVSSRETVTGVLIFFLVLPIANGLWDFVSWWISRSLGRHLLKKISGRVDAFGQGWTITWHIAVDLLLALTFLLFLAWFLGFSLQSYNWLIAWQYGTDKGPFKLSAFINSAASDPFGHGLWVSAMLLSTLLPTILHGLICIVGALVLFAPVTPQRLLLADELEAFNLLDGREKDLVLQRAGRYFAQVRWGLWLLATILLITLVSIIAGGLTWFHFVDITSWLREAAFEGIAFANRLFS